MIIDCHTHAFADKIADRAVAQLIEYYGLSTSLGGRLPDLLSHAAAAGVDALILLVAATRPAQVRPAHDWILSLPPDAPGAPRVIPFGTFHPGDPDWPAEVARLRAAGIRGIKLHPEFQGLDLADPRLGPFLEEIQRDFLLLVHVGDQHPGADPLSTPAKVARLLDNFPTLRVIAAHLGGYCLWEQACEHLAGREVYLDTSSALPYIDPGLLRRLVRRHDTERLLFGSDYPLRSAAEERRELERLEWLTERERERILGDNARRLLGLT
ncbi:MAG TPA: amidohydrolase family protein [Armatimonadota bacterium]|jgi:hypothetical protein